MEISRWTIIGAGTFFVMAALAVAGFFLFRSTAASYESDPVISSEGNRAMRVNDARLAPLREYVLSAPYSEKIDAILIEEGETLPEPGVGIAKLDTTALELELKRHEAEVSKAKAIVEKLREGTRFEELVVFQEKRKTAQTTQKSSKQSFAGVLYDAFIQADDAVRNKTDPIFDDADVASPQLSFSPDSSDTEEKVESGRAELSDRLDDWKDLSGGLKSGDDIEKSFKKTDSNIRFVRSYLDDVARAVNGLSAGAISQDTIDEWKVFVSTARANVSVAVVAMGSAYADYMGAKRGSDVAASELDAKIAGSDRHDVVAALDSSEAAKSQADAVSDRLKQAIVSAPEAGLVVKKIFPKKGEFVSAGDPVAIVATREIEMEADIPESDIRGIETGAMVIFRPAAYPNLDVHGKISRIEHQEIERNGSIYFRIHATLDSQDFPEHASFRTGMTGDLVIGTSVLGEVLSIPESSVSYQDGKAVVKSLSDSVKGVREKVIETGFRRGQSIEILSGLQVGDRVLR